MRMESDCFCGMDDIRRCHCLPSRVRRGQRGNRFVSMGDGRGGILRGSRGRSTTRGRDRNPWIGRGGSSRGGLDENSWRVGGGIAQRGQDIGPTAGRSTNSRRVMDMPRGCIVESVGWRGGGGRGCNNSGQRGARFPEKMAKSRGECISFGNSYSDSFGNNEGYYESSHTYFDEGSEGYSDHMEKWREDCYMNTSDGFGVPCEYGTDLTRGSRGAHLHSRGAGRGQYIARGSRNPRQRGARLRGSRSGSVEYRHEGALADRCDEEHDSDWGQHGTHGKTRSASDRKDNKDKHAGGSGNATKKITGKGIDCLIRADKKNECGNKGESGISRSCRKSRLQNHVGDKCPLGRSFNRSNSRRSNGSKRSRNSSDSSVDKNDSRNRRDKSDSSRSGSDSSCNESDSSRNESDSSCSRKGRRRRLKESDSKRSSSKCKRDSNKGSDEDYPSNGSSRSSSASSSSSRRNSKNKSRYNSKESQREVKKCGHQQKTSPDERGHICPKDIPPTNKMDKARKPSRSENHIPGNSNEKLSETPGSEKDVGTSVKSEANPKRNVKQTCKSQSSEDFLHQKGKEKITGKNSFDAPSKITKIGNAYVMGGSDPIVLTEEEYKFIMGCGTSSPQLESIVNATQYSPSSLDFQCSQILNIKEGVSQKSDTAPFPVIRYEWQFQDEQGDWITYGRPKAGGCPAFATTVSSDDIEKHYINDQNKHPLEFESNGVQYILDFRTLTQSNKHTSHQRSIRRVLKRPKTQAASTKILNTDSTGNIYKWQFQDEQGDWITYGLPGTEKNPASATTVSSDDIEKQYINDPSKKSMEIRSTRFQYILNFEVMAQTNNQTSVQRRIRRVLKHPQNESATPNNRIDAADSSKEKYEWQFQDEHKVWIRYGSPNSGGDLSCVTASSSDDIENHYNNNNPNRTTFLLKSKRHQYMLNFQTMTQTNLKTKSIRSIRRVAMQFPKTAPTPIQKTVTEDVSPVFDHEWFFLDESNRWVAYGQPNSQNKLKCVTSISSDDIEKHYQQDPIKKFYLQIPQHNYVFNFLEMTQRDMQTNTVRIIRRLNKNSTTVHSDRFSSRVTSAESIPANWSPMPNSVLWTKVLLQSADSEYTSHVGAIQKVLPNIHVVNMYRVQNKYLWKAYANKMDYLKQQFPEINYKEQFLYHGTDPANMESICKENVDWRLHGSKNGNSYGRGSYFSNSVQLSAGYSTTQGRKMRTTLAASLPSRVSATTFAALRFGVSSASQPEGVAVNAAQQPSVQSAPGKALFIVRVLIGNITQGNSSTVRPPVDGSGQPYDTTVNSVANPTIFVKYDTQEYYPEYFIEFD